MARKKAEEAESMKGIVPVGVVFVLIWTFLLFNVDFVFGDLAPFARTQLITYFVALLLVLVIFRTELPVFTAGVSRFTDFLLFFFVTSLVLLPLPFAAQIAGSFEIVILALGFGIMFAFVKAFIEELIFRGALLRRVGNVGQAILFGVFHATLLMSLSQLKFGSVNFVFIASGALLLTSLGFIWGFIARRWGTLASTGSHTAYNIFAMGLLGRIFMIHMV